METATITGNCNPNPILIVFGNNSLSKSEIFLNCFSIYFSRNITDPNTPAAESNIYMTHDTRWKTKTQFGVINRTTEEKHHSPAAGLSLCSNREVKCTDCCLRQLWLDCDATSLLIHSFRAGEEIGGWWTRPKKEEVKGGGTTTSYLG